MAYNIVDSKMSRPLRILVACEESQEVCKAFRARGHEAYSNDLIECSGGHPEWHLQMDCFEAIEKRGPWDMMVGFPPCTHIANAGGCHFEKKRKDGRQKEALIFFNKLFNAPIEMVALENPVGIIGSDYIKTYFPELQPDFPRKPSQRIQPFYFGDPIRKYTCLWLRGMKPLTWIRSDDLFDRATMVEPQKHVSEMVRKGKYRTGTIRRLYWQDYLPKKDRAKIKSKTFPGIARAMAEQWSPDLTKP